MDPAVCLVHPSKKHPVGVCHLCLRDRLVRLSLSGDSSSGHTLVPNSSSSRSSFDSSSCSKTDESNGNGNAGRAGNGASVVGKLGTIFSLIESDSEEAVARIEEKDEEDEGEDGEEIDQRIPSLPRSKSLSQWQQQHQQHPPRRSSSSAKDPSLARFAPDPSGFPSRAKNASNAATATAGGAATRSYYSPVASASATPVAHHVERDHRGSSRNPGKLSWISSFFGLRKRKKKSSHSGAVETNFFPPEAWNDDFHQQHDRDRLWRSRSVSSGRVIKKSFTPLGDTYPAAPPPPPPPGPGIDPVISSPFEPPRASVPGIEPRVASLIALDMREATKVVTNAAYDVDDGGGYVAGPRSSVASLMDIDRKAAATCPSPGLLQRSRSTGGWRRMIRSESPSSVLGNPTVHGNGNGDWGFYLTPLRTFNRNRGGGGSKHGR